MNERRVLLDLYAAFHKSGQFVDRAIEGAGIEPDDFAFVSMIGTRVVTPSDLAREYGQSLSTVLFRAARNVEHGYVERVSNPEDGRSFLLRLTPKGEQAWNQAGTRLVRALESLEKCLDRPVGEIQEMLLTLQAAFDQELAQSKDPVRR